MLTKQEWHSGSDHDCDRVDQTVFDRSAVDHRPKLDLTWTKVGDDLDETWTGMPR